MFDQCFLAQQCIRTNFERPRHHFGLSRFIFTMSVFRWKGFQQKKFDHFSSTFDFESIPGISSFFFVSIDHNFHLTFDSKPRCHFDSERGSDFSDKKVPHCNIFNGHYLWYNVNLWRRPPLMLASLLTSHSWPSTVFVRCNSTNLEQYTLFPCSH